MLTKGYGPVQAAQESLYEKEYKQPSEKSQVVQMLENLDEQICLLEKNITALIKKLSPIILSLTGDPGMDKPPLPDIVPLANQIRQEWMHLDDCNKRISEILRAIEL